MRREFWMFLLMDVSMYLRVDSSSRKDASTTLSSGSSKFSSPARSVPPNSM